MANPADTTNPPAKRKCSIEGCAKATRARGYCNTHWIRWRKHGDPCVVRMRAIDGEPLAHLLSIAAQRPIGCVFWPYGKDGKGYGSVIYKGQRMQVGRAMCFEIHGPPPFEGAQAAHNCGRGHLACFGPDCVRWATPKDNAEDRRKHGTQYCGGESSRACLNEDQVRQVLHDPGSSRDVAKTIGVSSNTVKSIRRGSTWKEMHGRITQPVRRRKILSGEDNPVALLTEQQVTAIFLSDKTARHLANEHGVHVATIRAIWKRKNWRQLTAALSRPA